MRRYLEGWRRLPALGVLLVGLTVLPVSAWAAEEEDAPAAEEEEGAAADEATAKKDGGKPVEEIVVTGSRIGRSNLEDFAHITVLSAEDIALSGVNTIDELLNIMPSITLQGLNNQNNNGGNGLVLVDLRNLGVGRTLVLVNGRRFIKSAVGAGVDLNNIPISMIERVEVLLDGASAVYGSDAIGGVINIILKDDFEGFAVDLSGGISDKGDGSEIGVSFTGGIGSEKGNFAANFTYMHRDEVKQIDRGWAKYPVVWEDWLDVTGTGKYRQYGSGTNVNGRYIYHSNTDIDGNGELDDWVDIVMNPDGASAHDYDGGGCQNEGSGWTDWNGNACSPQAKMGDRYNYGEDQWLIGMMERFSATVLGHYDFTENARVYMEGTYTNRYSRNQLAPQPIGFGTNLYPDGMIMDAANPGIPSFIANDINPEDPYLIGLRRMGGVGNRLYDNESDTFRLVAGVKGDITDYLAYDVYLNYGHHQNLTSVHNSVNRTKMEETMWPASCAANAHRGCVPGDYFGATLPNALRSYITYTDNEITGWDMFVLAGNLKGELFDLPGGPFTAVLGAETRKEMGYNTPSAVTQSGDSAGNALDPTEGSYNAQEVFLELSLPLLRKKPGVDALTIDLAGRFSHYNTFGNDFTYRAGLTYAPIADLRLRGVFSTAFRAPDIGDLYGGVSVSYESLQDPCSNWGSSSNPTIQANCAAMGVPADWTSTGSQMRTNIGGNANLDAETAKVANGGLVVTPTFAPKWMRGFSITVDYYWIEVDNAISGAPPQWLLDTCYESDNMSHANCAFVGGRNVSNEVTFIDATLQNISTLNTSGLDFTLNYRLPFENFGLKKGTLNFDIGFHGNYMFNYDEDTKGGEKIKYGGTITSGSGTYANFRGNLALTLSGELGPGNWSFGNRMRYIDGAKVFGMEKDDNGRWTLPTHHLPAVAYWDLVISYTWDDLTVIVGLDNVMDLTPPFFPEGGQNANIQTYDFMGRYVFAKVGYKF